MAPRYDLGEALLEYRPQMYANNPLFTAGTGMINFGSKYGTGQDPISDALVRALGQVGGGFLAGYGQSQVEKDYGDLVSALQSGRAQDAETNPLYPQVKDIVAAKNLDYERQKQAEEEEQRQKFGQALALTAAQEQVKRGIAGGPISGIDFTPEGGVRLQYAALPEKQKQETLSGFEMTPFQQKIAETAKAYRLQDPTLTANAAMEAAQKLHAGEFSQSSELRKRATTLYETADKVESIAAQAEGFIEQAGRTGGIFAPGGMGDRASWVASAFSDSEAAKRAAQAQLEALKPENLKANYVKGTGALSDYEAKTYLGSGPSAEKSPTENKALAARYKEIAKWDREKAAFLEFWGDTFGSANGVDKAWSDYKQNYPLFAKDKESAKIVSNDDRPSAIEWFKAGAPKVEATEYKGRDAPNISSDLLEAVKQVESGGNVNAVSPAGAQGAMQIMPATGVEIWKRMGGAPESYDPRNQVQQQAIASYHLLESKKRFGGDEDLALAAYNAGDPAVKRAIQATGGKTFEEIKSALPKETQDYVPKVKASQLRALGYKKVPGGWSK